MTPIIETPRLILRHLDPAADLDRWADMMSDADTVRYIGGKTMNRQESWRQMALVIGHTRIRGYGFMSVIEKATGQWVGRIGSWYPEGWEQPEVGWTLHRDSTGKGYAKEAGRACVDYAFETLGRDEVVHVIAHGNIGSIKTAEAVGSCYLREARDNPLFGGIKCHLYGQSRAEWAAARA